ncbi:MAG: M20/M25/M40 family metallo-hydrolase, partial [Thermoleophilaceae bacterium]|nr:M20/M25/M40 family metallo-hydrolase [Thermoleophilaceae bacterium]
RIAARLLLLAGLAALALAAGCDSDDPKPERLPPPPRPITERGLVEHLAALERIAVAEGGERAAGTPGYTASVQYATGVLRGAGWRVRVQEVPMALWRERSLATLTVGASTLEPIRDFRVPGYSAAGRVDGPLRAADDGCQAADFEGLSPGNVAFTGFGNCFLWRKTVNARRAGATALAVQTSTSGRGVAFATLAVARLGLPVVMMRKDVAARDGDRVQLTVNAVTTAGTTRNVIAEIGPASGPVAMAGGHLDSVPAGPGINDNGSGVATLLEVARTFGPRPPGRVRLGFWAGEEEGLVGSRRYVRELSEDERRTIATYLNLDMVGSPNAVPAIYSDGERALGRLLRKLYPGPEREVLTGNRSDHSAFERVGVPVNGLYTGATEPGPGGRPRDPCYHLPCDTLAHVDRDVLLRMARTTARALAELARRQAK